MMWGILAYGSLIVDPGVEIERLVQRRIEGVTTPFQVKFARKSSSRKGAPTLIPVETGGPQVSATILLLSDRVGHQEAIDLL